VGQGTKDELGAPERSVIWRNEADFATTEERMFPALGVRGRERQLEMRVAVEDRAELTPCISARPQYANRNLMHP
jgi:hypothetical protein